MQFAGEKNGSPFKNNSPPHAHASLSTMKTIKEKKKKKQLGNHVQKHDPDPETLMK